MSRSPNPSRAITCAVVAAALFLAGCGTGEALRVRGFDRDEWQQPERVVADLALAPARKVADLGAGGGYFTFRLARAVGPMGASTRWTSTRA